MKTLIIFLYLTIFNLNGKDFSYSDITYLFNTLYGRDVYQEKQEKIQKGVKLEKLRSRLKFLKQTRERQTIQVHVLI